MIVQRADPEAKDIGAMAIYFLEDGDIFLVGFADFGAVGFDGKAVGEDLFEGGLARCA